MLCRESKRHGCPQFSTTRSQAWRLLSFSWSPPLLTSTSKFTLALHLLLLLSAICSALQSLEKFIIKKTSICSLLSDSWSIGFERPLRKMNGHYSKMRATGSSTHESRSMDFSDMLHFSSQKENPGKEHSAGESRESLKNAGLSDGGHCDSSFGQEKREPGGESFRMVLGRSCSVASKRFSVSLETQSIGAQCSAMRRAFSMRRSSSVSERYCRIYDQSVTQMDHEEEDDGQDMMRSTKKKNKNMRRNIFKACKRLFGL